MNNKKITLYITIVGLTIIVLVATIIRVNETSEEKLYNSRVEEIIKSARVCVKTKLCDKDTVTLKFLYEKDLLTKEVNPKTNKYFNEESYIKLDTYEFVILD